MRNITFDVILDKEPLVNGKSTPDSYALLIQQIGDVVLAALAFSTQDDHQFRVGLSHVVECPRAPSTSHTCSGNLRHVFPQRVCELNTGITFANYFSLPHGAS